jgi:hypothetical protein
MAAVLEYIVAINVGCISGRITQLQILSRNLQKRHKYSLRYFVSESQQGGLISTQLIALLLVKWHGFLKLATVPMTAASKKHRLVSVEDYYCMQEPGR